MRVSPPNQLTGSRRTCRTQCDADWDSIRESHFALEKWPTVSLKPENISCKPQPFYTHSHYPPWFPPHKMHLLSTYLEPSRYLLSPSHLLQFKFLHPRSSFGRRYSLPEGVSHLVSLPTTGRHVRSHSDTLTPGSKHIRIVYTQHIYVCTYKGI